MTPFVRLACASLVAMSAAAGVSSPLISRTASGLKITIRHRFPNGPGAPSPGVTRLQTIYLQADRRREQWQTQPTRNTSVPTEPGSATITRCDTGEWIWIHPEDREYGVVSLSALLSPPFESRRRSGAVPAGAPNLLVETTTVDTRERQMMFGYQARHVRTTVKRIPLEAGVSDDTETVTDGWYIDLETSLPCERPSAHAVGTVFTLAAGGERPSFKDVGKRETGLAVASTTTWMPHSTASGNVGPGMTESVEVIEIAQVLLEPALFEKPAGFADVTPGTWGYYRKTIRQFVNRAIARLIG